VGLANVIAHTASHYTEQSEVVVVAAHFSAGIKALQRILVCSAVVLGVCNGILWMHYYDTRPRAVDMSVGRTIPLNTHGIVVYLTDSEHFRLQALMGASGGCFLLAILIETVKTRGKFLVRSSQ
jgi:hypothetical protein